MPTWYQNLTGDHRRAFWTSLGGIALDAMDVQLYAFVLPILLPLWGMSQLQGGELVSIVLAASALGGVGAGIASDRLGRVLVLRITVLCVGVGTCLCAFSQNFEQLLVARAIQGLGFGGEWAAAAVLVAEIAAPESRARMVGAAQSAWAIGFGLAAASSGVILTLLPIDFGWRCTFLVGIIPALLIFHMRRRIKEPAAFRAMTQRASWRAIFRLPIAGRTFQGSLLATGAHSGYWAVATWWPTILHLDRHFTSSEISAHLGIAAIGSFFGYATGGWLGDRFGRRTALIILSVGSVMTVLMCTRLPLSNSALLIASFPLGFFVLGLFSAVGPVLAEMYPTEVRGTGLGFCYNFGRGMAGLLLFVVGYQLSAVNLSAAIGVFAIISYTIVFIAAILIEETRSVSFNDDLSKSSYKQAC
ncbi:MFS transporter [Sphingomonas sp. PAMC 26605]|uniref:MFS transporter n=1 Tax=Sphingomonas sp. PAMC 26605 TaxID=1112214 RepID=UPI00026CD7F3|nr:MFS transporter [Sphingomonas sp. PAMC 26605]